MYPALPDILKTVVLYNKYYNIIKGRAG